MWMRQPQLAAMASLLAHVNDAVCIEDAEGVLALVNPAYCDLFGLSRRDDQMLPTTREAAADAAAAYCGSPSNWHEQVQALRTAAVTTPAETFATPAGATVDREYAPIVVGGRLTGHLWTYRDSTKRARLEDTLRQSQRLTTVGRLAGGIAHDFNNLLTAVVGYCDLLDSQFDTGDARRFDLHEIRNAAMRAAALTRQLLAFSRRQVMQPEVVDLALMVSEMQKMVVRLMSEQVTVVVEVPDDAADVFVDPGQIEQVMFSLAVNARDAMPDGGTFAVRVRVDIVEQSLAAHLQVKPGRYVHVKISDTGIGMDDETRANAFEPFFTTKDPGHRFGLGLGLPTAYGIVRQTGGAMSIDSLPGAGTTVHVYLPRHHGIPLDDEIPAGLMGRTGSRPGPAEPTVLVVEDETSVLKLVRRLLEAEHYIVLSAQNADEALLLAGQHDGPIHLLLTDVVMPGMNGIALAERFGTQRPETPVLFMSGYADAAVVQRDIIDAGRAFVQKPFAPERMLSRVRDVIDADR